MINAVKELFGGIFGGFAGLFIIWFFLPSFVAHGIYSFYKYWILNDYREEKETSKTQSKNFAWFSVAVWIAFILIEIYNKLK